MWVDDGAHYKYISPKFLPSRFGALRGLGVRIEDDVLITPEGCEVLSRGVPTARDEIEALVGSRTSLV